MKKYSISLVNRQMQMKISMRYHYLLKYLKLKRLAMPSVGKNVEPLERLYTVVGV